MPTGVVLSDNHLNNRSVMKDKIDVRLVLRAVARILEKGQPTENGAAYRGLRVESDYDGYTVTISNDAVRLNVLFHNRYEIDYRSTPAVDDFYETIRKIVREGAPAD